MGQNKREIKFRCFATTFPNKPMAFRYFNLSRAEDINRFRDCIISNPSSRMNQFTGLKDKNGKEIYEGDILEIEWENTTTRSIVKYHVGYASSGFVFMIGGSGFSECSGIENGKVIGNIYENPELLNKLNKQK